MLELPRALHEEMIGHAVRGLPNEACGLIVGMFGSDRVERFFPMRNAAESSRIYELDSHEMMAVEREVDEGGLAIIGVMHSHTHTINYPSPTDVADAARFDPFGSWQFVIVSLKDPDPSLRSYRILDGEITEQSVRVVGTGS